ncbi:hypothetical protein F0562_022292 [Nyssa sinensis]|uniref:Uncharacterized protein n=1 Tax=Nyssa sinensis TaxID=561372 RepID=A0A5J5BQ92_9ASTE|nr:hypothetical protein F0562_022292 [Nyssa sinensis]
MPAGPTGTQGGSSSVLLNPAGSEAIKVALKMGLPPGFNKKGSRQILGELMSGYVRAEKALSLQDELQKAQAELKAAQSEIQKGQTDLKAAQSEIKKKQSELLVAQLDLKHAQAKLKVADAELGVAQASVSSLETKCEAFQAKNISLGQKLGVMIDQRDLFRRRMDEQKKKFQDTEVVMAKKLEEVKEATKEATKTGMMDLLNSMGRELVDSGYMLCSRRIQKLYPNLDISHLDDVEVESLPSSPNPPDVKGFVEVVPPISSIPPKPK